MGSRAADAFRGEAEEFLSNFLRQPGAALEGWLADSINLQRFRNLTMVACEANLLLRKLNLSQKEVPVKVIHSLIEGASLEEEPQLRTCWANLFANAVDSRCLKESSPRFSAILKDLTVRDVKLLNALYERAPSLSSSGRVIDASFGYPELMTVFGEAGLARLKPPAEAKATTEADQDRISADVRELYSSIEVFLRHVVLHEENEPLPIEIPLVMSNPNLGSGARQGSLSVNVRRLYTFTMTGIAFVQMCQPPQK